MGRLVPFRGQAVHDLTPPHGPVAPWDVSFVVIGALRASHGPVRVEARVTMSQRADGAWLITILECGHLTPRMILVGPDAPSGETWEAFLCGLFLRHVLLARNP